MWLAATLLYLADFLSDAADAALPASTALCWMYDAAGVWTTVTSQVALRPDSHGTSQTIRPLTIGSAQTLRFFDCWCIGSDQCTVDEIIKPGVTLNSACVFHTRQGMLAKRIHHGATWARMYFADGTAQTEANSDSDGTVFKVKATGADWQCV